MLPLTDPFGALVACVGGSVGNALLLRIGGAGWPGVRPCGVTALVPSFGTTTIFELDDTRGALELDVEPAPAADHGVLEAASDLGGGSTLVLADVNVGKGLLLPAAIANGVEEEAARSTLSKTFRRPPVVALFLTFSTRPDVIPANSVPMLVGTRAGNWRWCCSKVSPTNDCNALRLPTSTLNPFQLRRRSPFFSSSSSRSMSHETMRPVVSRLFSKMLKSVVTKSRAEDSDALYERTDNRTAAVAVGESLVRSETRLINALCRLQARQLGCGVSKTGPWVLTPTALDRVPLFAVPLEG